MVGMNTTNIPTCKPQVSGRRLHTNPCMEQISSIEDCLTFRIYDHHRISCWFTAEISRDKNQLPAHINTIVSFKFYNIFLLQQIEYFLSK